MLVIGVRFTNVRMLGLCLSMGIVGIRAQPLWCWELCSLVGKLL